MDGFSLEENIRFGRRLALARIKAGLSQEELAQHVNFTQPEIALYERGRRFPTDDTITLLAEATQTDPRWLKYGEYDQVAIETSADGTEVRVFHPKDGRSRLPSASIDQLNEDHQRIAQSLINSLALTEDPKAAKAEAERELQQFKKQKHENHIPRRRNDPEKLKKMIRSIAAQYFPKLGVGALKTDKDVQRAVIKLREAINAELANAPDEPDDIAYFSAAKKLLAKKAREEAKSK
jgi:transcriptional regulator with XRE-family HTH domain